MKFKRRLLGFIMVSGFLFIIDQLLKYFARTNPDHIYYLWKPWIGWEYFGNTGVAFSLPVPNWLIVVTTPLVLLGLTLWFIMSLRGGARATTKQSIDSLNKITDINSPEIASSLKWVPRNDILPFAFYLIIAGAISNYIDRVFFAVTIDYLRVLTSVINLADVMIVGGVILLIWKVKSKK